MATISVPTLGIKGKKLGKKEKYVETIDPAPSTPAGEPLGEIEIEVSEEIANKLPESWSIEVSKNEVQTPPLALLSTTFPEELPLFEIEDKKDKTPPTLDSQLAPSTPSERTQKPNLFNSETIESHRLYLPAIVPEKLEAVFRAIPELKTNISEERENQDIPAIASTPSHDEETPTPPSPIEKTVLAKEQHVPIPVEETVAQEIQSPSDSHKAAPFEKTTKIQSKETPVLASTSSHDEENPTSPSPIEETVLAKEQHVPSPVEETVAQAIQSPSGSHKGAPFEKTTEVQSQETPVIASTSSHDEKIPTTSSPVEETSLSEELNSLTPQEQATPSLFRSRSFAALIDFSVATSFFVLGVLLFPDPPRIFPFVFAALYLLTKDSLGILNGQSIGKKIMKLRVVNRRDRTLSGNYKAGLLRNLSWLMAPIEFAVLYVREDEPTKGKRLGDDWAQTRVVSEEKPKPRKSKWLP